MKTFFGLLPSLFVLSAQAQTVTQSGNVTPGQAVRWVTNGVVGSGGTPTSPLLSGIGVLASGPAICSQSGTSNYNRICIGATSTAGIISLDNIGAATGGFQLRLNGVTQGFPTVTLPVTAGDVACFASTTGTLQDCGFPSGTIPGTNVTFIQAGSGAVSETMQDKAREWFSSKDFNFICDGSADNSAKLASAVTATMSRNGVLRIVADSTGGVACKFNSLTTLAPLSSTQNQIQIALDLAIKIRFNGTTGWLKFDGSTATGSTLYSGVQGNGAQIWPYVSGSAYAIAFLNGAGSFVEKLNFEYNNSTFYANGISADSTISCRFQFNRMNLGATGGTYGDYGIRFTNFTSVSNHCKVDHNEIVFSRVAAIASPGSGNVGIFNKYEFNYIENNTGKGMSIGDNDSVVSNNYFNGNTGAYDLELIGVNTISDGNLFETSIAATAPVSISGSNQTTTNTVFSGTAPTSGVGFVLTAASTNNYIKTANFINNPVACFTDAGTGNVVQDLKRSTNTFCTGTAYPVNVGGTGAATFASNGVLYGNGTSALQALAVNASGVITFLGQISSGAPQWVGGTGTGAVVLQNSPTIIGTLTATGLVKNSDLATMATNTVKGNATSGTASPTDLAVGSCSTAASALIWTTNTGFGCNTSITAAAVPASGITGRVAYSSFTQGASNTVLANSTNALADYAAFAMPSCSGSGAALNWTTNTGFVCNSSITAVTATTAGIVTTAAQPAITSLGTQVAQLTISYSSPAFSLAGTEGSAHNYFFTESAGTLYVKDVTGSGDLKFRNSDNSDYFTANNSGAVFVAGVTATGYTAGASAGLTTTVVVPCGTLTFTGGLLTSKGAC